MSKEKLRPIRFGLSAIKGLGDNTAQAIIEERKQNGRFKSIFDLTSRISNRLLNRKGIEALVYAGALDSFRRAGVDGKIEVIDRARYFAQSTAGHDVIEVALQYGQKAMQQKHSAQFSLFGESDGTTNGMMPEPEIPYHPPWPLITRLNHEREVIGFYLSGHPLDKYKLEITYFATCTIQELFSEDSPYKTEEQLRNKEIKIAGIVTKVTERISTKGTKFGMFTLEDFSGTTELSIFGDDYAKLKGYIEVNNCIFLIGNYQPSWRDATQFEFRIREIKLLDSVLETYLKTIIIQIDLDNLTDQLTDKLYQLLSHAPKGNTAIRFEITDPGIGHLPLHSRNLVIKPTAQLFEKIQALGISVRLKQ